MDDLTLTRLVLMWGPDVPPVAAGFSALPDDHPLRVHIEQERVDAQERAAERAALRAAAEMGKGQAGQGSPVERLAALEARVAALEEGA